MDLVVIFGPPAVGKMAVGRELAELTGLRLFHNHLAIEPALELFPFGSDPFARIVGAFRDQVFREVAGSDLPGLIFTYVWSLDDPTDKAYVDEVCDLFRAHGATVHFVELRASLEARLARNRTELRLSEKRSKRDVEASEARLLDNERLRLNTDGDFFYPERHVLIDNTHRTARDVAEELAGRLGLERLGGGQGG